MNKEIEKIIRRLKLQPHPEGGYYRETYRSELSINEENLPGSYHGNRACSTSIYFLLSSESFSAFHRILQDEIWHFYHGSRILLHMISPIGEYEVGSIGMDLEHHSFPQFVVPAGNWFAVEVPEKDSFALVGCTVAPGFDFRDFELAERAVLIREFPQHASLITRLSRT